MSSNQKIDRRRSPEFCTNCNSKIDRTEIHLPINKINNGKEIRYCEIRIKRIKKNG